AVREDRGAAEHRHVLGPVRSHRFPQTQMDGAQELGGRAVKRELPPIDAVLSTLLQDLKFWPWRPHRVLPYLPHEDLAAYYNHVHALYSQTHAGDIDHWGSRIIDVTCDIIRDVERKPGL